MEATRRAFLRPSAIAGAAAALGAMARPRAAGAAPYAPAAAGVRRGDMLYRRLGRTGEEVSLIGLGDHHIGRPADEAEGIRIVRGAIERGITDRRPHEAGGRGSTSRCAGSRRTTSTRCSTTR